MHYNIYLSCGAMQVLCFRTLTRTHCALCVLIHIYLHAYIFYEFLYLSSWLNCITIITYFGLFFLLNACSSSYVCFVFCLKCAPKASLFLWLRCLVAVTVFLFLNYFVKLLKCCISNTGIFHTLACIVAWMCTKSYNIIVFKLCL